MGIESDQVVYEYLSRVGDIAQQRQLPSADRMRLVSGLRNEIDRHRARAAVDSPAAVRRILDGLGTPDEVVTAAGGGNGGPQPPPAAVPAQPAPREPEPKGLLGPKRLLGPNGLLGQKGPGEQGARERGRGLRRGVPRPRPAEPEAPARSDVPSPPHLAGEDELGDSALQPDWWRVDDSPFGVGDSVPGFVGGVEIPELLKPPPKESEAEEKTAAKGEPAKGVEPGPAAPETTDPPPRRRLPLPRPAAGWTNPLLLLAAAALVAGAVLGNWFALIVGWLIAYGSRRLTAAESKWAVMGLPGLVLTGGLVWLWGRSEGRWGDPVAQGHMSDALTETWPWAVRAAALTSAAYILWRSQRHH
ncbi:hypothetical protein ABZ922_38360 [Streptomyces shenzhenensis]|uniref:hypothetical protein n=1 Tax=Streptomyces shenzhenensis TaxID=943815 RepID=UPI0033F090CF